MCTSSAHSMQAINIFPSEISHIAALQEFMVAMECFFFEWYGWELSGEEGGPVYGRTHASDNAEALAVVTKEGQASLHPPQSDARW